MKKIGSILFALVLCVMNSSCLKRDSLEDINIYTSNYAISYIAERLYGEHSTVYNIYPLGVDPNIYELNDKQIKDYSKASLFIFNGLGKEKEYVIPMFNHNKNIKIIDTTLSMEYENSVEELWLDPSNFLMMVQNTKNGFKEYINNHYLKNEIEENYELLKQDVSNIDAKIRLMMESSNNKSIVVADDTFKFLEKYNFIVYSLDEDTVTEKVISDARNLINSGEIEYIYTKKNQELNEQITTLVNETNIEIIELHTIDNITEEEKLQKQDYITLMNSNIELLKKELYD